MRVIVAHPNAQHSHRLALAVQKAGWLQAYVTQFYYDPTRFPYSLVRILPHSVQRKLSDRLSRRNLEGLNPHLVVTYYTWAEMIYILLNRTHIAPRVKESWLAHRSEIFSKRVGKLAAKSAEMVIGTDTASYHTFRIARGAGVICVLDHSYVHINTCLRIESEERLCEPVFSRTFDRYAVNKRSRQHSVEEVELADAVIVASSFSKESLIENGVDKDRIYVVPYGIDLHQFESVSHTKNKNSKQMNILFVGGIGQRKGIGYLLEAVHELKDSMNITTTLIGALRGDTTVYEKYQDDFIHLDQLSRSQIPSAFQSADVFVFPSLIEGFGLVILEAMASGLPVITTTNTGGRDVITDGIDGFVVPIRDVTAIKERLIFLFENPSERIRMGIAARKKAELYSWDRYYAQIADVLADIYNKKWSITSPLMKNG